MANKEKVIVQGGGDFDGAILQNAASEETLKKLVQIFEGKDKDKKGSNKIVELFEKVIRQNIAAQREATESNKEFNKTLGQSDEKFQKLSDTMSEIIGLGLGSAFSLIAVAGKSLVGFFTDSFKAFQDTSRVGASFNNNLIDLRRSAAEAAIPLDEFVEIIKKNSSTFSSLSGTVSEGAKDFGRMAKELRDGPGEQFLGMGWTLGELNEGLAGYLEIQTRVHKVDLKNSKAVTENTAAYLEELDKLTKITGMSRQAAEEAARKASVDPIIQSMQENAVDLEKSLANIALITQVGGEESLQMLKEMAANNPSDAARMLMATTGMEMDDARKLFTGEMGMEGMIEKFQEASDRIMQQGLRAGKTAEAIMARNPALATINRMLNGFRKLGDPRKAEKEMKQRDEVTKAMAMFPKVLNDIYGQITSSLLNSGVFDMFAKGLTKLADLFLIYSPQIAKAAEELIKFFDEGITSFFKKVETDGIKSAIKDLMVNIFTSVGEIILDGFKNLFWGMFTKQKEIIDPAEKQKLQDKRSQLSDINDNIHNLKVSSINDGFTTDQKEQIKKSIEELEKQRDALSKEVDKLDKANRQGVIAPITALMYGKDAFDWTVNAVGSFFSVSKAGASELTDETKKKIEELNKTKVTAFDDMNKSAVNAGDNTKTEIEKVTDATVGNFKTIQTASKKTSDSIDSVTTSLTDINDTKKLETTPDNVQSQFADKTPPYIDAVKEMQKASQTKIDFSNITLPMQALYGNFSTKSLDNVVNTTASFVSNMKDSASQLSNNTFDSVTEGINKLNDVSVGKISDLINNNVIGILTNSLISLKNTGFDANNAAKLETINTFLERFNELQRSAASNVQSNGLDSIVTSFNKVGQIDVNSLQNTVSGISKVTLTLDDNLTNNTKGVDDYIKSIDKLTSSLDDLQKKIKDMPDLQSPSNTTSGISKSNTITSDISGISAEDLQKQLNTKMDDLISHIVEMKQNTKDTADAMSGRKNSI
jgi:hypothetical protein